MGVIVVEPTSLRRAVSSLGPVRDPFSLLNRNDGLIGNSNLGGRYALPVEFDSNKYASAFYAEGNEAHAMQRDQPILGTALTAPGWKIWTYPARRRTGELDEKGKLKLNSKNEPLSEDHPSAGEPHKVHSMEAKGQTLILMYRSLEVQQQVNEAYAQLSREITDAELSGETSAVLDPDDPNGILTAAQLASDASARAEIKRDEAEERSYQKHGPVAQKLSQVAGKIKAKPIRISR
jgi:hypothetical protein